MNSTRRALLIGAPVPDLRGVERDLELMTEALVHHGFAPADIEVVSPATRETVELGFANLIAATGERDVVVVYYSGHGAKIDRHEPNSAIGEDSYYRFLVLSDFEQSTEDRFRGYTNVELSLRLEALTARTRNVTVIMDCCFAGRVFRKTEKPEPQIEWQDIARYQPTRFHQPRGRWEQAARRHFERLQATEAAALGRRHSEANPFAVQLLASAAGGKAYEVNLPSKDGTSRSAGAMTAALHKHLLAVNPRHTTWQDLGRLIRMTPRRGGVDQKVSIEGPYRRLLFALDEREELGAVDVEVHDGEVQLVGGLLAGLRRGDCYELVRRGDQQVVGEGRIDRVERFVATVATDAAIEGLEAGSSARPLRYASPRACALLVGFEGKPFERELIRVRLEASGLLRVHEPSRVAEPSLPVVARLSLGDGRLQLWSGDVGLDVPRSYDPGRSPRQALQLAEHLVDGCRRLARAALFRALAAEAPGDLLDGWTSSWARVESGQLGDPLPKVGAELRAGDHISIELHAKQRLFVSMFAIHADGRIELLSRAQGGGVEVEAGKQYIVGQRSFGPISGVELVWPSVIRKAAPLATTIVTIVSDQQVDLRCWEQLGIRRHVPIDPLAEQSKSRNFALPRASAKLGRYRIETIQFTVAPALES